MICITDIQRFCMHDGPGLRTTVFFKGCPLRCAWCHNPETQRPEPQSLFYKEKCIACGACAADPAAVCPTKARETVGETLSVDALFDRLQKDRAFFGEKGGVTFSGGECMQQIDALEALLKRCKESGIGTAVDTSGCVPFSYFERILPYTDLFLYDIKCLDPATHKRFVGVDNAQILDNAARLLRSGAAVWIRVPIVPTVNDREDEMQKLRAFLAANPAPQKVELLPYHAMGDSKYRALGFSPPDFPVPGENTLHALRTALEK